MTDLLLGESEQAAVRAVIASDPVPDAALPGECALQHLARLIDCDALGIALVDGTGASRRGGARRATAGRRVAARRTHPGAAWGCASATGCRRATDGSAWPRGSRCSRSGCATGPSTSSRCGWSAGRATSRRATGPCSPWSPRRWSGSCASTGRRRLALDPHRAGATGAAATWPTGLSNAEIAAAARRRTVHRAQAPRERLPQARRHEPARRRARARGRPPGPTVRRRARRRGVSRRGPPRRPPWPRPAPGPGGRGRGRTRRRSCRRPRCRSAGPRTRPTR